MVRAKETPPNPLQCTIRSILQRDIFLPDFFQRNNPLCPLRRAVKQYLRVTGCRAGVYFLGTVDDIESVALNFRVLCAQCVGSPKSSCAACTRARHWSPRCSPRPHKPNNGCPGFGLHSWMKVSNMAIIMKLLHL